MEDDIIKERRVRFIMMKKGEKLVGRRGENSSKKMKAYFEQTKEGAAAFYIVAIATLVLVIIAVSFSSVILSSTTRTSNDDLSQSAYDSALAGVEDAKVAYINYVRCKKSGASVEVPNNNNSVSCGEIIYLAEHPSCDSVARILGRINEGDSGEVSIRESGDENNLNQAYTCAELQTLASDYRSELTAENPMRVIRPKFGFSASKIDKIKISWYPMREGESLKYGNFVAKKATSLPMVVFPPISGEVATPPVISVQIAQTAEIFNISQINDATNGDASTDRATAFLSPTGDSDAAESGKNTSTYVGTYNKTTKENVVSRQQMAGTNDRSVKNLPFLVLCSNSTTDEFACTATIELPSPIGGQRNSDTFVVAVSLPYGQPNTGFRVEFLCGGGSCPDQVVNGESISTNTAFLSGVQVIVDSTGRANDLYRRIEARLEVSDSDFAYPFYAVEVLGDNIDNVAPLVKNMVVKTEYNF